MTNIVPYVLLAAMAAGISAHAAPAAMPLSVVELYTSEGCSSCPPAEKLLERLADRPNVLALSFHVDYWDNLGWRDRFSLPESTARQQALTHLLKLSTLGTPQFIVDGQHSVFGANPLALEAALSEGTRAHSTGLQVAPEISNGELRVQRKAEGRSEPYDVYLVGYLPKAVTKITRGENAGRTLTEANVVRAIKRIGRSEDSRQQWRLTLPDLEGDAQRFAVLIQSRTSGAIVAAEVPERR